MQIIDRLIDLIIETIRNDIGLASFVMQTAVDPACHLDQIALIKKIVAIQDDHVDIADGHAAFQDTGREDVLIFIGTEILNVSVTFFQLRIDIGTGIETGKELV